MARKKVPTSSLDVSGKKSAPLAQKLNSLITDPNKLKDYLGCSTQAINQYRLGISRPTLENLCKIADYYNVTTDYLLGRTPRKTVNEGIKAAARYTGLSESALSYIHDTEGIGFADVLDKLILNESFQKVLTHIYLLDEDFKSIIDASKSYSETLPGEKDNKFNHLIECEDWLKKNFGALVIYGTQYREWQIHTIIRLFEDSLNTIFDEKGIP